MKRMLKNAKITACVIMMGAAILLAGSEYASAEENVIDAEATAVPTAVPTEAPTAMPTEAPTAMPSVIPTSVPVLKPTDMPTATPVKSSSPSAKPSSTPEAVIKFEKKSVRLLRGESVKLKLKGLSSSDKVKWSSADSRIVSVNKKGRIKAVAAGNTLVKAEINSVVYKCRIRVKNKGIDYSTFLMQEGEMLRLHIDGADNVKWSSSDKSVASVKAGKVKALKKGKVIIKAVADKHTYTCDIVIAEKSRGVIYLTFDDGPSLSSTPKILDILKNNNVKATFFTIGMDSTKAELIKREAKEGHTVAIHGAIHDYNKIYTSETAYMNNIKTQQKNLKKLLGYDVWITRFPGGSSNLVSRNYNRGIMTRLVKTVNEAGFAYFDWNVSSNDAGGAINSSQVYKSVISGLNPNRDNVVLMHDFANNNKTIDALDSIIKYGKKHGYEFRAISTSTTEVHHGVQN